MNNRIREARIALGLSMAKFGEAIGISSSAVNQLEHGKNRPAERTLSAICYTFNVRREWLDTGVGEMFVSNLSSAQAIEWASATLAGDDTFQRRLLEAMSRLNPDEWCLIEKLINDVAAKEKGPGKTPGPVEEDV